MEREFQYLEKNKTFLMSQDLLELTHLQSRDVITVKLTGTLDFTSMRFFRDYLHHLLDQATQIKYLHLECSTLHHLDQIGLGCLLYFYRYLHENHIFLNISHLRAELDKMIRQHSILEHCLVSHPHTSLLDHVFDLLNIKHPHSQEITTIFAEHARTLALQQS